MAGKPKDITGARSGRLVAVSVDHVKNGDAFWLCKCDCGNETVVLTSLITREKTKSCGCIVKETSPKNPITHGYSGERLYNIWNHMLHRCFVSQAPNYGNYGGRGISVCDDWKDSYVEFKEWALSHGYDDNLSIDRIDNNGNYEPSNCRWASGKQQSNNKRTNRVISYNGKDYTSVELSKKLGIPRTTLIGRLARGLSIEESIY